MAKKRMRQLIVYDLISPLPPGGRKSDHVPVEQRLRTLVRWPQRKEMHGWGTIELEWTDALAAYPV